MMLIISVPLLCLLITVLWISQSCYALYFGHSLVVTKDRQPLSIGPNQIAISQKGIVHVVWNDNETIYFRSIQDNENKFSPKTVLSNNNKLVSSPQIAATEKGNVYVAWVEKNSTTENSNIVFRSSNDSGKSFGSMKKLGSGSLLSFSPQIAATEKGNVYVAWVEKNSTTGNSNIVFRSSNDSGKSFGSMKELSSTNVLSFYPQIAATEKGNVYVVWVDIDGKTGDSDIAFRGSNDSGENFTEREDIRRGNVLSLSPQITATEKGNVHIVWVDVDKKTGDSNIAFKSSNDSGESFAQRKVLRTGKVLSFSPQISATDRGNVYVVWIDKNSTTGDSNIGFRSSNNSAESFDKRVYLNRDKEKLSKTLTPQIVTTEKGNVFVVWVEGNVKFKELSDKESQTGETISLNSISNNTWSSSPQLVATENGNVYVVWNDINRTGIGENLLFKKISEFFFDRNS